MTLPKKTKDQKYCKFDLFTDAVIGLGDLEELFPESKGGIVVQANNDEDYITDAEVMRNTKKLCKKDFLETYRLLIDDPRNTERNTHNYAYQRQFGVVKQS